MVGKLLQFGSISQKKENESFENKNAYWTSETPNNIYNQNLRTKSRLWHLSYIPLFVILVLLFLVVLLPLLDQVDLRIQYLLNQKAPVCFSSNSSSHFEIVESIPEGLVYPNDATKHSSTYETWKKMIGMAEHTIEIASFYWSMRQWPEFPEESKQGDEIFNDLLEAGLNRNISIRIARSEPSKSFPDEETTYLISKKAAVVKYLNFSDLVGSGVLHTKFWIVDRKHVYVGSANMDWRALTQVKELGIALYNSSCVAEDLGKIFDIYWIAGNSSTLPSKWPDTVSTIYNSKNPLQVNLNNQNTLLYISSSPHQLSANGRTDDLSALLNIIKEAKQFIHISVMDYMPLILFTKKLKYWSVIDDALRKAVVDRNVQVRLLTSEWPQTRPMEFYFLRSMLALNKFKKNAVLEVKLFKVPSTPEQSKIPHARVNHNKYMVTDNGAFIGTSNWSGDYFIFTAGVSVVSPSVNGSINPIQQQLKDIFDRDWNSSYVKDLPPPKYS